MKTQQMIKTYRAKMKKIHKRMVFTEKCLNEILKVENPTKEQMKEAVLLFGGISRMKKVYHELDSIVGSLLVLSTYNLEDL